MKRLAAIAAFHLLIGALSSWASATVTAAEPFFFIQLSDPQFGMYTTNAVFAQETANLEFAVATINRLRPAFVVVTGDLVNKPGDAAQIAEYRRIMARVDPAIPIHNVAGNHDLGNVPTPASIAAWTTIFGPDFYSFRHGDLVGIVLNSCVIHTPQQAPAELAAQERWLRSALERARNDGARNIVVFQHHPVILKSADEPDQYFNLPRERRSPLLALLHEFGVKQVFCGHYHQNAVARDGDLEVVTTGPVGKPLGDAQSGLRIVIVRGDRIEHRYYSFGDMPDRVEIERNPAPPTERRRE